VIMLPSLEGLKPISDFIRLFSISRRDCLSQGCTLNRLEKYFHGLRDMVEIPAAMFVVDIGKEDICIAEARRMGVKIFAIVDSDCNPDYVNQIIPGNDDAVRSIRLITSRMATAILEGTAEREARLQAEREELGLDELQEDELTGLEAADLGDQPLPSSLEGLEQEFLAADDNGEESSAIAGKTGPVGASMVVDTVVAASAPEVEASPEPAAVADQLDEDLTGDQAGESDADLDDNEQ